MASILSLNGRAKSKVPEDHPITRRHPEWVEHEELWRRLQDSYEGGERYRSVIYGTDAIGQPIRNLIRHKRELPEPLPSTWLGTAVPAGSDPYAMTAVDDYELRRARTPVPSFLSQAIECHLSKIYGREITRDGPEALVEWWDDVDGRGTPIDIYMQEQVAPLLLVCGQLDLAFDHPARPANVLIQTRKDELDYQLNRCVVSYILPENMLWWDLDSAGRYRECVVREWADEGSELVPQYRHWLADRWVLYDDEANTLETQNHGFGRVPIVRCFDKRKYRTTNVGQSYYEPVAMLMREFYNRDSELILSDTIQAHPLFQMPEDFCQAGLLPHGPGFVVPMKRIDSGSSVSYQGASYIDPPKGGADSIRANKQDLIDRVDRHCHLTKPAGASGTTGQTVAQSGISKQLDSVSGHDYLSKLNRVLSRTESVMAEFVILVLTHESPTREELAQVHITYPSDFNLYSADELATAITEFQGILSGTGELPDTERLYLERLVRVMLPGLSDPVYEQVDAEIQGYLDDRLQAKAQQSEMQVPVPPPPTGSTPDPTVMIDDQKDQGT